MLDLIVRKYRAAQDVNLKVEGFTVLRGESNSGKSSTLKAVRAAMTNRFIPRHISYGADESVVKLRFDNSPEYVTCIRKREGSPVMTLGEARFSKLNRDVPPEIENYYNIGTIAVGDQKFHLNFCAQFQPPLLVGFSNKRVMDILSSSKAMDELNEVSALHDKKKQETLGAIKVVDTLVSKTRHQLSDINLVYSKVEMSMKKLINAEETLKSRAVLRERLKEYNLVRYKRQYLRCQYSHDSSLENILDIQIKRLKLVEYQKLNNLSTVVGLYSRSIENYLKIVTRSEEIAMKLQKVSEYFELTEKIRIALSEKEKLEAQISLNSKIGTYYLSIRNLNQKIDSFKTFRVKINELIECDSSIESKNKEIRILNEHLSLVNNAIDRCIKLASIQEKITRVESYNTLKQTIKINEDEIVRIKLILETDICPFCMSPLDGHKHV